MKRERKRKSPRTGARFGLRCGCPVLPILLILSQLGSPAPLDAQQQDVLASPRSPLQDASQDKGTRRLIGPPLFPLYYHYENPDGSRVLNILYLFQRTTRPDGDGSNLLLPLYYWQRQELPRDNRLFVFPLLFFRRDSEDTRYTFLPLYFDYRTQRSTNQLLFPFWYHHGDVENATDSHHILFPFARYRTETKAPDASVSAFRMGIYRLFELAEAYEGPQSSRLALASFFNFRDEAGSPFALFSSVRKGTTPSDSVSHTHLFPFYWSGDRPGGGYTWLFPFFGYSVGDQGRDVFLPLLLSRFGSSPDGDARQDVLFPLYHRSYGPGYSSLRMTPLFGYHYTPRVRTWGLLNAIFLNLLYENQYFPASGKTAHSFLWPLGRYDVEPDGVDGHIRFLPLYWDSFDSERRYRISPVFYNYQRRSGVKVEWDFTYGLPTYFGWGSPKDHFAFGFPLYWQSRAGKTGWDLFLPFHFSFFSSASYGVHILPLVSYNSYPSESQLALLGPLFVHRRFYGFDDEPQGSSTSFVWPLTAFERRPDRYHYRFLPLGWTSKNRDEYDLLLFPLFYRQWGGGRSQNYFFPLYGRYDSETLTRDFFLLGTYVNSRERDERGNTFRRRHDVLWSLYSDEENTKTRTAHRHFLPLGYWQTRSVPQDRTILGPLYYGHRIDGDKGSHRLNLVAGNLLFSKQLYREVEVEGATDSASGVELKAVESEQGVLWPLLRWGYDAEGHSSQWVLPIFYRHKTPASRTLGLFPLFYVDTMQERYKPGYFRYFFLTNWERWDDGDGFRLTLAQLLFDWKSDPNREEYRWRFLYPLFEYGYDPSGYHYTATPILRGAVKEEGGIRRSAHFLFPLYFSGAFEKKEQDTYEVESDYFYLFPFYGTSRKPLRTTHEVIPPFFHVEYGESHFRFALRPLMFYRNDPEERSFRLWPLHSFERGESSGEWWVTKYLYFSKTAVRNDSWSFRLDPFLFRASRASDSAGVGGLFELWTYDRKGKERTFRLLPFTYGYTRQNKAGAGVLPFYYGRNFGSEPIDYWIPWRFFFLANHLRNQEYRYTSLLTLLMEYEASPRRPDYSDLRLFFRLFQSTKTESSRTFAIYPFFYYSRDSAQRTKTIFSLIPFYRYEEEAGSGTHYLLWFIPVGKS